MELVCLYSKCGAYIENHVGVQASETKRVWDGVISRCNKAQFVYGVVSQFAMIS